MPEDNRWAADRATILQGLGVLDPNGKPTGRLEAVKAAYPFPDLLTFHDAPTPIEQRLFVMFLEHRMRAFQGTFHANPDYALWYGWSEMRRDLTGIQAMAHELRQGHGRTKR